MNPIEKLEDAIEKKRIAVAKHQVNFDAVKAKITALNALLDAKSTTFPQSQPIRDKITSFRKEAGLINTVHGIKDELDAELRALGLIEGELKLAKTLAKFDD